MHPGACAAISVAIASVLVVPAEAGRGTNSLRLVGDDARVIVVADVARARSTSVFKKGYQLASDKSQLALDLALDRTADTIILASAGSSSRHDLVIVEGKLDKLLPEVKKRATATDTHGGITYWSTSHGDVAVIDKKLVVATTGDMPAVIDRAADKKRGKGPAALRRLLASPGTNGAAIVAAVVPDDTIAPDLAKQLGASPRSVLLTVGLGKALAAELRIQFADDAGATAGEKALEGLLSADLRDRIEGLVGKEFADSIAIDRDHAVTRVSATLSSDEVDKLLAMTRLLL